MDEIMILWRQPDDELWWINQTLPSVAWDNPPEPSFVGVEGGLRVCYDYTVETYEFL